MDKGYDNNRVMDETRERSVVPVVCLRKGRPIPLTPIPYGTGGVEAPLPSPLRRGARVRALEE
jgi:hypothetical protein